MMFNFSRDRIINQLEQIRLKHVRREIKDIRSNIKHNIDAGFIWAYYLTEDIYSDVIQYFKDKGFIIKDQFAIVWDSGKYDKYYAIYNSKGDLTIGSYKQYLDEYRKDYELYDSGKGFCSHFGGAYCCKYDMKCKSCKHWVYYPGQKEVGSND